MSFARRLERLERETETPLDGDRCRRCGKIDLDAFRAGIAEAARAFERLPPEEQERQLEEHKRAMAETPPPDYVECAGQRWTWEEFKALPDDEMLRIYRQSEKEQYCRCRR